MKQRLRKIQRRKQVVVRPFRELRPKRNKELDLRTWRDFFTFVTACLACLLILFLGLDLQSILDAQAGLFEDVEVSPRGSGGAGLLSLAVSMIFAGYGLLLGLTVAFGLCALVLTAWIKREEQNKTKANSDRVILHSALAPAGAGISFEPVSRKPSTPSTKSREPNEWSRAVALLNLASNLRVKIKVLQSTAVILFLASVFLIANKATFGVGLLYPRVLSISWIAVKMPWGLLIAMLVIGITSGVVAFAQGRRLARLHRCFPQLI
ncbi:MAG: hypothetical protein AAGA63_13085 [Pseudomonadota bacterium]